MTRSSTSADGGAAGRVAARPVARGGAPAGRASLPELAS